MSATDPVEAMHHSPALWGLLGASAAAVVVLVGTLGWNIAQHYQDKGVTIRAGIRASLHI